MRRINTGFLQASGNFKKNLPTYLLRAGAGVQSTTQVAPIIPIELTRQQLQQFTEEQRLESKHKHKPVAATSTAKKGSFPTNPEADKVGLFAQTPFVERTSFALPIDRLIRESDALLRQGVCPDVIYLEHINANLIKSHTVALREQRRQQYSERMRQEFNERKEQFKSMVDEHTEELKRTYVGINGKIVWNWIKLISALCAIKVLHNDFKQYQAHVKKYEDKNAAKRHVEHQAHTHSFISSMFSFFVNASSVPGTQVLPPAINFMGAYAQHGHAKLAAVSAIINSDPMSILPLLAKQFSFIEMVQMSSILLAEANTEFDEFSAIKDHVIQLYADFEMQLQNPLSPDEMIGLERAFHGKIAQIEPQLSRCITEMDELMQSVIVLKDPALNLPHEIQRVLQNYRTFMDEFRSGVHQAEIVARESTGGLPSRFCSSSKPKQSDSEDELELYEQQQRRWN